MPSFGVALAWMIISPCAFFTDCLAIICIFHYKPLYHSCDIAFISIFVTMATNAWLLLPIPAVVKLGDLYWSQSLCAFYTWLSVTLRSSHILVLLVLNVYWMASIRVSSKNKLFTSAKPITVSVCICWFISIIVGLIPAVDVAHLFGYYEDNVCKFLPSNISRGFAIFFIIVPLVSTVMGVVSSLDSLLLFKAMKEVALTKYSADRFHLPTISGGIRTSSLIHAKYNELNVTIELCRLVLVFSMMSSVLNAIPLLASQFVQQIQIYSRETLESTLLWLLLLEALILPHVLWLMSKRYRHAVAYTWRVFVLRDASAREEDTASCSLQAFRVNVKDVTTPPYRNGGVNTRQVNGTISGTDIEDHHEEITRNGDYNTPRPRSNGVLHAEPAFRHNISLLEYSLTAAGTSAGVTTGSATEMTLTKHKAQSEVVVLHETTHQGMTYAQKKIHGYNVVHETSLSSGQNNEGNTSTPKHSFEAISKSSSGNSTQIPSPTKSPTKSAGAGHVKRSISGSSRMEWKERMMKKHLPSVFLNTSVEDETDTNPTSSSKAHAEDTTSKESRIVHNNSISSRRQEVMSRVSADWTSTESTYYVSGDYHYDYLNDTLGRSRPHAHVEVGESDGKYADEDIKNILDTSLRSENCVNGVDICDSDNYLLTSLNIGQFESHTELLDNGKYTTRTIKDIALPSDENHPRDTKNSVNSHTKYTEHVSNNMTKTNVPYNDQPFQDPTRRLSEDRTALGGRSIAESVSQSTATIVSVSTGQPSIRRSNYRKFLPYTDLIISDVDDATAGGNVEQNEKHGQGEVKELTTKSELPVEGLNSPNKETITEKEIKASTLSTNFQNLQKPETRDQFATSVKETHDDDDDYLQDYSKCETVSGSEMLRLKMKSIRAASALYLSDDTTSEEGGIDNNGFTETSNDDSDDNNDDKYYEKQNTKLFNNSRSNNTMKGNVDRIVSRSENANKFRSNLQVDDDDEFVGIRLGRNWVGDGQESTSDGPNYGKAAFANHQDVKQGADNQKEPSVDRNDNQQVKSDHRVEPTPSGHFKNMDQLPVSGLARTTPQTVDHRRHGASEADSYTHLTDSANEYAINDYSGSAVTTIVRDLHIPPAGDSTHAARQPGFITKPPRHRKHQDENQLMAGDSNLGSIQGTVVDFGDRAITTMKNGPYQRTTKSGIPVQEDMASESDISEVTDTDSTGSELSVTLEHYGERRPDWMNDVLLDSSSYEQTMFKRAREFPSLEEASTDFMSNYNGKVSNLTQDANLKKLANHEKMGYSYNGIKLPDVLPHQPHHPLLIPYHFNDHTDEDDENNSIMIDYSAQSNFYRHKNLYFEAIKEEPEDLLSDSASSFDQSENSIPNGLRDQPLNLNGILGSNIAGKSISPISINTPNSVKTPQFEQHMPTISRDSVKFPTIERTSADGSEETPPPHSSNCLSNSQTLTSMKTDIKNTPHAMQQISSGKDLANQTAKTESISTFQSIKYTEMQNVHSPSTTVTDTVHSSVTPLASEVNKHDLLPIANYRAGKIGDDLVIRNNGPVDFYSEVQFPAAMEAGSRNGKVPDATPVYF